MITIRNATGHTVAKGPAMNVVTARAAQVPVERVDVYPHPDGPALLGVAWKDGSTGICDWNDSRACLDWLREQAWAAGCTTVHYPKGARA